MIDELKKLNPNCLYYKNCINNIVIEVLANVGALDMTRRKNND